MRIAITNDEGEVFEIVSRDADGRWTDSTGAVVAETDRDMVGGSSLVSMHELITDGIIWEKAA